MRPLLLAVALLGGAGIAYVDSRPGWDDTGVTAAAIAVLCGLLGLAAPERPWWWAVGVGGWVPAVGLAAGNPGSLIALAVAFAGAYTGAAVGAAARSQPAPAA